MPCAVRLRLLLGTVLIGLASATGWADDLLPPETTVTAAIDHYVGARWEKEKITPAPAVSDAEFLRRVTLDLAGRIPTLHELRAYVAATEPDKKQRLIERLVASPDFAFHQRNRLDEMLLADLRKDGKWRDYLLESVRSNKPWDQMFREMMLADQSNEQQAPALEFLKARVGDVHTMTNDTSRLFFGVSINCAQCHDHPLVDDWKQDHYFGFASFFNRTYKTKSNRLAEKFDGTLNFRNTHGEEKTAQFMFLTGLSVTDPTGEASDEQKKEREKLIKASMEDDKAPLPEPEFRPREKFVEIALAEGTRTYFAQSIVNRMWAAMLGRGIIDPPDQNHSGNVASHPELLQWLERDLVAHNYDLKRLLAGIAGSEAYARSSLWEGDRPDDALFAVAKVRTLTPRQYSLSLLLASHDPARLPASIDDPKWSEQRQRWEGAAESLADRLERPTEHFQVSVDEALLFSNDGRVEREYLRDSDDKLIGQTKKLEQRDAQLDALFEASLNRLPTTGERAAFSEYLAERSDRPVEGLKQVFWALLTSPEMRFNY